MTSTPGQRVRDAVKSALAQQARERPTEPLALVKSLAQDIAALRRSELYLQQELQRALAAADRAGRDEAGEAERGHFDKLVSAAQGGASRATVSKWLQIADLEGAAMKAIASDYWRGDWSLARVGNGRIALRAYGDYMDIRNEAPGVIEALQEAGLRVTSDGPGDSIGEDLARHRDALLSWR